jgi:uncharacterized protein
VSRDDHPPDAGPPRGVVEAARTRWRRIVTPPSRPEATGPEPRRAGWRRVLGVSLAAFAIWLVLDAPTLQNNAQVSPVGTRRTVSLDLLGPLATISRGLGLSHVVSITDGILGRHGNRPGNGLHGTVVLPKPSATPTTLPKVVIDRHPTTKDPLRVLVLGDSLGIDLGDVLVNDLTGTGIVTATLDGQVSTGLTRPDYFNWPAELSADLPRYSPQVIVVMMGANDAQDFPGPPDVPFGTPAWDAIYRSRVESFMAEATSGGAEVIWVGMPPMQDPVLSADISRIDGIVRRAASRVRGVEYLASWTVLGTPTGQFTPYLVVGGQEVNVREPDGTHISPGGAQVLSTVVEEAIRTHLHIDIGG